MTHIVKMTLAYQPSAGPSANITTLRRVPDTAQCFLFAMEGDIDGVRSLMIANKASTKDVAVTTGYTMLTVRSDRFTNAREQPYFHITAVVDWTTIRFFDLLFLF